MVHGECWVNCPTGVGNLEASTVCWGKATRRVQLSRNHCQPGSGRPRSSRIAVKNVVLSQEDKPERHRSAREISHETAILYLKCTQENNSAWYPAHTLQTTSCSAVVWSQSYLPSHSLINNLIVCNKSCYCSIINRKLNWKSICITFEAMRYRQAPWAILTKFCVVDGWVLCSIARRAAFRKYRLNMATRVRKKKALLAIHFVLKRRRKRKLTCWRKTWVARHDKQQSDRWTGTGWMRLTKAQFHDLVDIITPNSP